MPYYNVGILSVKPFTSNYIIKLKSVKCLRQVFCVKRRVIQCLQWSTEEVKWF